MISASNYLVLTQILLSGVVCRHGSMSLVGSRAKSNDAALDARDARVCGVAMRVSIGTLSSSNSRGSALERLRGARVILRPDWVMSSGRSCRRPNRAIGTNMCGCSMCTTSVKAC